LQRWGTHEQEREWLPTSDEDLIQAVGTLASEFSAILVIEWAYDHWLAINASDELFSVSVQLNEGAFHLIGNPAGTGKIPFILGGQEIPHPRRYLVSLEQARAASLEFFWTGTVDVANGTWERQGPQDAWRQED
jgi:hypothetical protein